ncbi:MAG: IS66 family transposase [Planctomycetes bacterium]|nr:IS66 family transposase [Planctomycetota bacterium]
MDIPADPTIEALLRKNAELLPSARDEPGAGRRPEVKTVGDKQSEIDRLQHKQALIHRLWGRRSEKGAPGQLMLFHDDAEQEQPVKPDTAPDDEEVLESTSPKKKRKRGQGKARSAAHADQARRHSGGEDLRDAAASRSSASARMREGVRLRPGFGPRQRARAPQVRLPLLRRRCGDREAAAGADREGMPGPGLLAQIVTAKYADHLPLYRQEAIFLRHGLELSRQTMCDWLHATAHHLSPIVLAMRRELLRRPVIQSDDTHVLMQTHAASKGCQRASLWTWTAPERDLVLYEFELSKSQAIVEAFLADFAGEVVVADGFSSYNTCLKQGVKRGGCFAHARRYVREATTHPREASELLVYIQMLYAVEKRAKELDLDAEGRSKLRQAESKPILDDLRAALDRMRGIATPEGSFFKAWHYLDAQWPHLTLFVEDGRVPIDNNNSEQMMRPVAVGRKNWLFTGSIRGGKNAAIFYSVIGTCKLLGIPPFEYLRDVLSRISTHPHRLIHELTPAGWKAARDAAAIKSA